MQMKRILVIDGQGGKMGKSLIEAMRKSLISAEITAIGTNSIATANMIKGGADKAATGENPVITACRTADIIVGPIGIAIADSLLGEVTQAMAVAIGQCKAVKILIPINRCENIVVGIQNLTTAQAIEETVKVIKAKLLDDK